MTPESHQVIDPAITTSTAAPLRAWSWLWPKLVLIGLIVGGWEIVCGLGHWPSFVPPTPQTVARELVDVVKTGHFWTSLETSLSRAASGYALALVVGTAFGFAAVQWRLFRRVFGPLVTGTRTLPPIVWFPLAILLFGSTYEAVVYVAAFGAFPYIAGGTIMGSTGRQPHTPTEHQPLGTAGPSRHRIFTEPAGLITYLRGLRQGWTVAWASLIACQIINAEHGTSSIGDDLHQAFEHFRPPLLISLMIAILIVGLLIDALFGLAVESLEGKHVRF